MNDTDYGLAPETQYPNSLYQIIAVYKCLLSGGLGFTPGKIAIFGESAGMLLIILVFVHTLNWVS